MASPKKFGAFGGVFTPSILTILGVIMYMRLGWVVGNAGLWGTLIIIGIAHIISLTTGLSISSIATDKKVGAGGVYYVLSRSLGLPIGGAIGVTLFVGTAFSIALYLIGFSESFNAYLGIDMSLNGYRLTAGIALLVLTIIAFISTSIALKTQFIILIAIILSLVSIFFGVSTAVPETVSSFGGADSVPMEMVFAIFFPAVTGFTAGIAMSGDLKDPKKSIPKGTLASIFVGLIVYVGLAIFIAYTIDPTLLKSDNNILIKIAWVSPFVVAGIWGATLSSAIGGILGGPRILQAMSFDKITPNIFAKGTGKDNEPRYALILTVIIAASGILIGELNLIARLVSMFYLAAYGFINLSFFLESWASTDFNPSFKVNKWIGFLGFVTTFIIMFRLDMIAMFASFAVIGGIYLWLSKKEITHGEGDIWQSVWTNIVKRGLRTLDDNEDHKRNWKPNILLFSGKRKTRKHLLEFSRFLAGKMGIITNFDLIENKEAGDLFTKHKQSYNDELLEEYGVFGRHLEVNNVYEGIESIASVFGFSGIEPNTVLMGWARNSQDPKKLSMMTNKLINLDYNVLYLDYDKDLGFGKHSTIDLWWRGISSNAELSLMLVKLLHANSEWGRAKVRIILVNNSGDDHQLIKKRIENLIKSFRVKAEVFIINNYTDNKSIYDLMKIHSGDTDLIILGVPDVQIDKESEFVNQVNNLVDVLGTTLLVKASTKFEVADLGLEKMVEIEDEEKSIVYLPRLKKHKDQNVLVLLEDLDKKLRDTGEDFQNNVFGTTSNRYISFINEFKKEYIYSLEKITNYTDRVAILDEIILLFDKIKKISSGLKEHDLDAIRDIIKSGISAYNTKREGIFDIQPEMVSYKPDDKLLKINDSDTNAVKKIKDKLEKDKNSGSDFSIKVKWKKISRNINSTVFSNEFYNLLSFFLHKQSELVVDLQKKLYNSTLKYVEQFNTEEVKQEELIEGLTFEIKNIFAELVESGKDLIKKPGRQLFHMDRSIVNKISETIGDLNQFNQFKGSLNRNEKSSIKQNINKIDFFSEFWHNTNRPILTKTEIDLTLNEIYFKIIKEINIINEKLKSDIFDKIEKVFSNLNKVISKISIGFEGINDFSLLRKNYSLDKIKIESDNVLTDLQKNIEEGLDLIPENIDILSQHSYQELMKNQLEEIETIDLSINKISSFLFSSQLMSPLEIRLNNLKLSIEETKSKLNNFVSLLSYIARSIEKDDLTELKLLIKNLNTDFHKSKEEYDYAILGFNEHMIQIAHRFNSFFNIDHILNNASELDLHLRKEKRQKGVKLFIANTKNSFKSKVQNIMDFISRKNEDVKRLEYEKSHDIYIPDHVKIRNVITGLNVKREVFEILPFYYHKIFTGKHFSMHESREVRTQELLKAINDLNDIKHGVKGGVLVTGKAGIGKTYFIDKLVETHFDSKVNKLNIEDYLDKYDNPIEITFQNLARRKGNLDFLISDYPIRTIFVIENIEMLLGSLENGRPVLDVLADLIEKYGNKYYFILSANSYSLKTIDSMTQILGSMISTIVLSPLSNNEINNVILERHYSGNIELYNKGVEKLTEKELKKLIEEINSIAKGNPGIAFQLWLTCMKVKSNEIVMDLEVKDINFDIKNPVWLSVLNRMIIFGNISKHELDNLFSNEIGDDIQKNLSLLTKAGLVEINSNDQYKIVKHIKPFVERWLKNMEVI